MEKHSLHSKNTDTMNAVEASRNEQGSTPGPTLRPAPELPISDPLQTLGEWIGQDSSQEPLTYIEASNIRQSGE